MKASAAVYLAGLHRHLVERNRASWLTDLVEPHLREEPAPAVAKGACILSP